MAAGRELDHPMRHDAVVFKEKRQERRAKLAGGVALIGAQKALDKLEAVNENQAIGVKIIMRSIKEPLRQIVANAGEDAAVVLADALTGISARRESIHMVRCGMSSTAAVVALSRKLARVSFTLLRTGTPFVPNVPDGACVSTLRLDKEYIRWSNRLAHASTRVSRISLRSLRRGLRRSRDG